ncbi:MAG TPA: carboxymuconolactone decarboxylase family protein [Chitinophagaceae bacterium]|jgi:AhpD family alkylhydroperoxidase
MSLFNVPSYDEVSAGARAVFDQLKKTAGKVPNLYATIGYSGNALASYMAFTQAQAKGTFHAKDREAIYLIVSQINGCPYCLASHTLSGIKSGWTEEETLQLRAGKHPDKKWEAIYQLIYSIIEHRGQADAGLTDAFFAQGYKEAALIDLVALVMIMSFTNYVYRLTEIPIDFPAAKPLEPA